MFQHKEHTQDASSDRGVVSVAYFGFYGCNGCFTDKRDVWNHEVLPLLDNLF